jgi:hypothetical protein
VPTRDDFREVGLTGGPGLARMVPRELSTTEALMTDPTTPEGAAYRQERHDYEEALEQMTLRGETMTVIGEQEGVVTVGVLQPSSRVQVCVDGDLTFEEPEHVDMFIDWLKEAKAHAERTRWQPEPEPR